MIRKKEKRRSLIPPYSPFLLHSQYIRFLRAGSTIHISRFMCTVQGNQKPTHTAVQVADVSQYFIQF